MSQWIRFQLRAVMDRIGALLIVGLTLSCCVAAQANMNLLCDTPVYRYALYRWTPSPYILCRIHDGEESDPDVAAVRAAVENAADDPTTPANIIWVDVDAADSSQLETLPPFVRERWEKRDESVTATYYLVAPHGAIITEHAWKPAEIAALFDSPLRRQIGKAVEEAKAGAVVVLECATKPKETAAAKQLVRNTVEKIRSGKLQLATAPSVKNPDVAVLSVPADSDEEKWLVQQLLHVESDLASIEEPMVFLVFGRGRALFSCLGKGITEENIARDIEFVSGACSCTVKEQNPGVDLLMRYDWENAATIVAEQFGGETGAEALLDGDQLFPELAIPAEETAAAEDVGPSAGTNAGAEDAVAAGSAADEQQVATDVEGSGTSSADTAVVESDSSSTDDSPNAVADSNPSVASRAPIDAGESRLAEKKSAAARVGLWRVAAGLGVVLVGLFAATWLVLRPRGS